MKLLMEKREVTTILINVICIKMLLTFPRTLIMSAGNAAWIQVLFLTLLTFFVYFITVKIYEKAGKQSVLELAETIGGRWLKILIGFVIVVVLFGNATMAIRAFPESIKTVLLQGVNMPIIVIGLGVAIGIGAYIGIEALGRINTIFLPVAAGALVIYLLLALPYCQVNNLFPILGKGALNVFVKGVDNITLFADIIVLNLLLPYCKNYETAKKSGYYAIGFSALLAVILVLIYSLIFRYPSSTQFIMPAYQISRIVRIGPFFQRFDAFFEFIWSISLYMYGAIYIFIIAYVIQDTFHLQYGKPIIFAVTAIAITVMFLPTSMIQILTSVRWAAYAMYCFGFFLPILLGFIFRIKCKGENNEKK